MDFSHPQVPGVAVPQGATVADNIVQLLNLPSQWAENIETILNILTGINPILPPAVRQQIRNPSQALANAIGNVPT